MRALLNKLKENNILLEANNGELQVFAPDAALDPELLDEIRSRKAELLQFLSGNNQAVFSRSFEVMIPAAEEQVDYPLSAAQRRMWLASRSQRGSAAYN